MKKAEQAIKQAKIVIFDDQQITRLLLKEWLESLGFSAVSTIDITTNQMISIPADADLIILELYGNNGPGFELLGRITKNFNRIPVLIFTRHDSENIIKRALSLGAKGFVSKMAHTQNILEGLQALLQGQNYVDPKSTNKALSTLVNTRKLQKKGVLSEREKEIMHLTALGETPAQMAQRLALSPKTVYNHRANIMRKLKLKSNRELLAFALRNNFNQI